jgi:hypothetical protein
VGFNSIRGECLGLAGLAVLGCLAAPLRAQQQGPVIPQVPAGAPQAQTGPPAPPAGEPVPIAPGTPARPEPLALEAMRPLVLPWAGGAAAGSLPPKPTAPPAILPPGLPSRITIPAGTRIPILLDTPLSSQFSREGQAVIFHTNGEVFLTDDLRLPPGVEIHGRLSGITRPGAFGKSGALGVTVERLILAGSAPYRLRGQLRSAEFNSRTRLISDRRRAAGAEGLLVLSAQGALAGVQFGGKAAGIGAGAGAALAAVLMMSKKGSEVSVSAGTPFSVRLQQDVELPAAAVYWAQQDYADSHPNAVGTGDDDEDFDDSPRPVLKRRPPGQPERN